VPDAIPQHTGTFKDPKDKKMKHYYAKAIDEVLITQLNRASDYGVKTSKLQVAVSQVPRNL
jgi:hypothetical protein